MSPTSSIPESTCEVCQSGGEKEQGLLVDLQSSRARTHGDVETKQRSEGGGSAGQAQFSSLSVDMEESWKYLRMGKEADALIPKILEPEGTQ